MSENEIGIAVLSFFAGAIIFYLLILIKLINICDKCAKCQECQNLTLQEKIINSFENTLKIQKRNSGETAIESIEDQFKNDYINFFNNNPEYNKYQLTESNTIETFPDSKFTFWRFILDTLDIELIDYNTINMEKMDDSKYLRWLQEKKKIQYYANMSMSIPNPDEKELEKEAADEYYKTRNDVLPPTQLF
jgi:hypothetical protein